MEDDINMEEIKEAFQKVDLAAGRKAEKTLSMLMERVFKSGMLPKTALQLTDATMEGIYTQAYNLYNQGKYKDAMHIFRLLMMLDYTTPKYTLGLAACLHRLKEYKSAVNIYMLAGLLDPNNPIPHYHASDCYLKLQSKPSAVYSLELAINAAGNQKAYAIVKERCELMKKNLEEEISREENATKNS